MIYTKNDFSIDTEKSKLDISFIHEFLSKRSYWAEMIPEDTVVRSIEGSLCFGIYSSERQVGFARVITDTATFAYLADVFVDESFRGLGLSKWLMDVIISHPDLQNLRQFWLGTLDAHGLYAQYGFKPLDNPERIMRKYNPDVYRQITG